MHNHKFCSQEALNISKELSKFLVYYNKNRWQHENDLSL